MGASQENPLSALLIYGYDLSRKIPSPNLSQLPPISLIHKRLLTASKDPYPISGKKPGFPRAAQADVSRMPVGSSQSRSLIENGNL